MANADTGSTTENAAASGNVLRNDTDADTSDVLTVAAVNGQVANVGASVVGSYGSVVIGADGSYSFTPNGAANALAAGETATDTFTYTVSDGNGGTATASLTITITGTNDGPVANADTGSTDEDTVASGNVLSNDSDADASDVLAVSAVNGVAGNVGASVAGSYGSVVIGADGSYSFTPNGAANALAAGETATDTFTYTVSDGNGGTATASLAITITGTNDGPVANADTGSTTENAAVSGNVLANDTDADASDILTVSTVNGSAGNVGASVAGTYGSVVIGADGSYSFTPNAAANALAAGQTATDTFTYTVSDGNGGTATASLTITITGTNDGPVAVADTVTTNENTAATGNVLTNDTDVDTGDTKTVSAVNGVAGNVGASVAGTYGAIVIGSNGAYTFTPNAAANALAAGQTVTDTFIYTMRDAAGATSSSNLTVTITGANDGPVAVADTVTRNENTAATGNVLTNDTDVDTGDTKTVSAVNGVAGNVGVSVAGTYGSVVIGSNGAYTFTPNAAANALAAGQTVTDTFTYTMRDAAGATSSATLTVTVTGVNDRPTAVADVASVQEDVTTSATGNVLTNDTDPDTGDTKTVSAVNGVAGNVGASVAGTYGSVTIGSNGAYAYTLNNGSAAVQALRAGQSVTDSFTYTVRDAAGATNSTTLRVTVSGTNDAPVAVANTAAVQENVTNSATGNVLTNDTDVDTGDTKTVSAVNGVAGNVGTSVAGTYGSVTIGSNGAYTYTLNNGSAAVQALGAGQTVTDTFTYTMRDGAGATSSTTLTVTVTGTNDAPVAVANTASAQEDVTTSATGNVLTNDTDVDTGDTKAVSAVNGAAGNVGASVAGTYGSVVIGSNGAYTYTLNNASAAVQGLRAGQTVTDTFTYTMRDAAGATSSTSLTVTVTGTNDAPVAVANTANVQEDVTTSGHRQRAHQRHRRRHRRHQDRIGCERRCRQRRGIGGRHLWLGHHRGQRGLYLYAE